jgi:hypothetical protein
MEGTQSHFRGGLDQGSVGTDIHDAGGLSQFQRASKSAKHLEPNARAAITKRFNQDNSQLAFSRPCTIHQ